MATIYTLKDHLARRIAVFLAVVSGIGAIALAVVIKLRPNDLFDVLVTRELQESPSHTLLAVMQFVSLFGLPNVALVMTAFAVMVFLAFDHAREALFIALTPIAALLNAVLKMIVDRSRPLDSIVTVYQQLSDPSFPSGHVVYYVVFFGFLMVLMFSIKEIPTLVRVGIVTVSAALIGLVSISRVYLGVHWATDVLEGYFVGYLFLFALSYWYLKNTPKVSTERVVD